MIAKNSNPHLEYVDELPEQNSFKNRFKYTSVKQIIKQALSI